MRSPAIIPLLQQATGFGAVLIGLGLAFLLIAVNFWKSHGNSTENKRGTHFYRMSVGMILLGIVASVPWSQILGLTSFNHNSAYAIFPVLLYSDNIKREEAQKAAGADNGLSWAIVNADANGNVPHVHPTAYGKRIIGCWYTDRQSSTWKHDRWDLMYVLPRGNQVEIFSSARADAGHREGYIHVIYEP